MPPITRRGFLGGLGAVVAAGRLQTCSSVPPPPVVLPADPFTLGVASGDPRPDGMVLWTRLAMDPLAGGGMPDVPIEVECEVATDASFTSIIAAGATIAFPRLAHSVRVPAVELPPDTWFFYRFRVGTWMSPVGRTRTTPSAGSSPGLLRLGTATCQHWCQGYYHALGHLAEEDLDVVFFLGDYIYEATSTGVRAHGTPTATTLADYRNRYALYKTDPHLQAAHAACPWVVTWDDHEVVNNYAGDEPSSGGSTPDFLARRAAAYQAWWEHQPVLLPPAFLGDFPINRMFEWGDLARIAVLDGRRHRTGHPCGSSGVGLVCEASLDPTTSMLGVEQEAWLAEALVAAPARWHGLAQQTVLAPLKPNTVGAIVNLDQWDGYPAAQGRMLDLLESPAVSNPVVLTGDIHCAIALDVHRGGDTSTPRIATELVATSISSRATVDPAAFEAGLNSYPVTRHANAHQRGYLISEVTPAAWTATFRVESSVVDLTSTVSTDTTIVIPADP